MVEHILPDLPKASVARYSGAMESIFAFCSFLTMYSFGRASDHFGRKPVIIFSFVGTALCQVAFGISQTFVWALTARALSGALGGSGSVLRCASTSWQLRLQMLIHCCRTMLGEIIDKVRLSCVTTAL